MQAFARATYRADVQAQRVDLATWLPLTNFPPLPVTRLQYTDSLAPLFPRRFYRTVWTP